MLRLLAALNVEARLLAQLSRPHIFHLGRRVKNPYAMEQRPAVRRRRRWIAFGLHANFLSRRRHHEFPHDRPAGFHEAHIHDLAVTVDRKPDQHVARFDVLGTDKAQVHVIGLAACGGEAIFDIPVEESASTTAEG